MRKATTLQLGKMQPESHEVSGHDSGYRGTGEPGNRGTPWVGVASRKCLNNNEGFSPGGPFICGFPLNHGLFPQPV